MGRMQSKGKGKGISSTATPFKRRCAKWVVHTPRTISDLIVTMAKKGMSPSQIGVTIRDKEAVPSIKLLTGQKIVRLLKKNGSFLVRQAVPLRSLRTSTVWSRKQWISVDTWRSAAKISLQRTDLSWSSHVFIDWLATTKRLSASLTSGNSTVFIK